MRATKFTIRRFAFLLFVLVCSASMSLYWSRYIDAVRATLASSPGLKPKALSDLYPSWYAPRELLLHHRDPYGAQVNRELQIAYYGKELDPSRPEERRDQQRFVYPLYLIFLVGPLVWMPFHTARVVFFWSLAACAALNVVLWLRFLRMRLSWPAIAALFVLVMTSIPVLQNLTILQPFLLPACFIAGTAAAVVSRRLFLAGALLAVATVKPQICVLLIAWLALWVCSDWKRRRPLLWGFTSVLAALILASAWLLPGWLIGYPNVLIAYAGYTNARSFLEVLLPSPLHWLVAILALATAAGFCWRARHEPADSAAFAIALSFALTLTVSIVPTVTQPFNHILLLPAVLLAIRYWGELRNRTPLTRFATSVFCLSAFLPWLFAVVAISRPLTPNSDWLLKIWSVPLASSMALPFAAFGVLILLRRAVPWQPTSRPLPPGHLAACMAKNKEQAARG
jgi:hypothetical protein